MNSVPNNKIKLNLLVTVIFAFSFIVFRKQVAFHYRRLLLELRKIKGIESNDQNQD